MFAKSQKEKKIKLKETASPSDLIGKCEGGH